ncbi:hypothetical protein, partial [Brachybacterium sp. EE-P12]|uniref:hypothetical protein n=1 Tax=Brachybacterium sp. EE-P12 TaxID=2306299 RepID=UPI0019D12C72
MTRSTSLALPPGLSLLWESADEHAALRDRFGFADVGEATDWLVAALHEHWGLTVRSCGRLTISDHNAIAWVSTDRAELVVKWSRAFVAKLVGSHCAGQHAPPALTE